MPYFNYEDEAAVKKLFISIYPRLISYARNILGEISFVSAEDVVNETFYNFLKKRPKIQNFAIEPYIYVMVRNKSLNLLKKAKTENNISLEDIGALQSVDNIAAMDFFSSPPDRKLKDFIIEEILAFCDKLPARTGEIFRLSRIEGMKNFEIAEMLKISQRAVEKHISISISRYREEFLSKKDYPVTVLIILALLMSQYG